MARVVLAMSGGVDSSVAALLLRRAGHEVVGLFMRTGVRGPEDAPADRHRGCCSAQDASDARRVADELGIPFYALDFEREFGKVIDYFADEYLSGRTPNPCVVCNNWLKFGQLRDYGLRLGADVVATGHYARIETGLAGPELHRAADRAKDQSYVLFGLPREMLGRVLFPIGDFDKAEVRVLAREAGLPVAEKPDSVDICFVPDGDHTDVVRARRPGRSKTGTIVESSGRMLGRHDGIEAFTVGQRKGLGVAAGSRRYVLRIVPDDGTVVVGAREELAARGLVAERVNWLTEPPADAIHCTAQIRYHHEGAAAVVQPGAGGTATVEFAEPQPAVSPGQAVVLYSGSRVLGGGWIDRPLT